MLRNNLRFLIKNTDLQCRVTMRAQMKDLSLLHRIAGSLYGLSYKNGVYTIDKTFNLHHSIDHGVLNIRIEGSFYSPTLHFSLNHEGEIHLKVLKDFNLTEKFELQTVSLMVLECVHQLFLNTNNIEYMLVLLNDICPLKNVNIELNSDKVIIRYIDAEKKIQALITHNQYLIGLIRTNTNPVERIEIKLEFLKPSN